MSSKAIWGFGGFQVMNGYMTYGQFTTYFGYLGMIFGPLNFFKLLKYAYRYDELGAAYV